MSFKFLKILLFFPCFCGAQSFFELDTKAKDFYDEGKFIEASKELKKIKTRCASLTRTFCIDSLHCSKFYPGLRQMS